jgi:hypothetical protein
VEEKEEAIQDTVSTISFIQANLQHSIAASRILTRTVGIKGIDMALIQELWHRMGCIRSLNIPGYTLYSVGGKERPRACIVERNMNAWVLPGFSCRDLVAVLVKYTEDGAERRLVVSSAYLPFDSKEPPPSKELVELVRYCENEHLYLIFSATPMSITAWGSTNCNGRGEALIDTFVPYKSSSVDGIFPVLLQEGQEVLIPYLFKIFCACLATGNVLAPG